MKKKFILLFCIGLTTLFSKAQVQTVLTLDDCQKKAYENYPMIKQYDLISLSGKYTLENISKTYLPQFGINAQATYQTDVTKFPVDLPIPGLKIPSVDKDQYKIVADLSQIIWDGGVTDSQHKLSKASTEVEKQKVEVSLYSIREKINQLYFGILALDEQLNILDLLKADLEANSKIVRSMFANGVSMQSDVDQIDVELLNISQKRIEQLAARTAYLKILSAFINQELADNTDLQKPMVNADYTSAINRPEISYYAKQRALLDVQQSAIIAKNMPKLSLFAQGGYGKPGLNMLESKFSFFAIGGIRLNWNFGSLYTLGNDKKLIKVNRNMLDVQEDTFLFNTSIQKTQEESEMQKFKDLMKKDDEVIALRNRIKLAGESKYKNGVYQISDLIRDINAAGQAAQTKSLHEIQYLLSVANYNYIKGN